VLIHLDPLTKRLWDALPAGHKSRVLNNLIAYGMESPKGAYLVKQNTNMEVETTDGVITLKEKTNA
jgi:hypothetical protein